MLHFIGWVITIWFCIILLVAGFAPELLPSGSKLIDKLRSKPKAPPDIP
jgi:hypothetical protein